MKIKYLTSFSGLDGTIQAGDVREVNDTEGARLCSLGHATTDTGAGGKLETAAVKQASRGSKTSKRKTTKAAE